MTSLEEMEISYQKNTGLYELLCKEICSQLAELLSSEGIVLASPLEYRVKRWASIIDKIERNQLRLETLDQIRDIAGIRMMAVFRRDVEAVTRIIESNFDILRKEDTSGRLTENQFGYGSIHYEVKPPAGWLKVPTLRKLEGLQAEIQVRTGSQHIWAAASHILQYKKEVHVPVPLRRSISRVAALLETVDLEFERLLTEREQYVKDASRKEGQRDLDTESLRSLMDEVFPQANRTQDELYAVLLDDLRGLGIGDTGALRSLIEKHLPAVMVEENQQLGRAKKEISEGKTPTGTSADRVQGGVYYTHTGLCRRVLYQEFGEASYGARHPK